MYLCLERSLHMYSPSPANAWQNASEYRIYSMSLNCLHEHHAIPVSLAVGICEQPEHYNGIREHYFCCTAGSFMCVSKPIPNIWMRCMMSWLTGEASMFLENTITMKHLHLSSLEEFEKTLCWFYDNPQNPENKA